MDSTPPAPIPPPDAPPRRPVLPWLGVALLAAFYLPAVVLHATTAADPMRYNDDARQQVWPFLRYADARLFARDYIADYYLACFPAGYKALYAAGARVVDPRALSKAVPYPLLAVLVVAAGAAAWNLRGPAAGLIAAAFCLGSPLFLGRMTGGLPRSFAFPLYALAALALVRGRPLWLAAVVVAGAAFYPTVAVVCGFALALTLFLPATHRGGRAGGWGIGKRLAVLGGTAALAVLTVLPTHLASARYGPVLGPADAGAYPELAPGGRYEDEARVTGLASSYTWRNYPRSFLAGLGGPWEAGGGPLSRPERGVPLSAFAVLGIVGFVALARADARALRLAALFAAAVAAHLVSIPVAPRLYLPARYQLYPLSTLAAVVVPVGIAALPGLVFGAKRPAGSGTALLLATCGVYLLCFSGPRPHRQPGGGPGLAAGDVARAGFRGAAPPQEAALRFVAALPPDVRLAGWPADLDDVPYVSARPVLISKEVHQVFHRRYADDMRRRAYAVIDACYAADAGPLLRLRDEFGVTHFLVDRRLYDPNGPAAESRPAAPPGADRAGKRFAYFPPFDRYAEARRASLGKARPRALAAAEGADGAAVLEDGDRVLLDLRRLPAGSAGPPPE